MNKIDDLSPEEILDLLEKIVSDFRFGRHDALAKVLKKLEEKQDKEKLEEVRKELLVQDLYAPLENRDPRFHPMMSGTTDTGQTWEYPNINKDFSDESVDYYKKRANETKNAILKARYCDFLWFYKKDFEYAKKAVEAYLECAKIYFSNEWDMELADSLLRALEIARSINNKELKKKSVSTTLKFVEELKKSNRYRYLIEIIDELIGVPDYLDVKSLTILIEEAINYFQNNKDDSYNLQRDFLRLLVKIYKDEKDKKEEFELKIAKNLVQEAEWKKIHYPKGNLVASSIYKQALKVFQDLGRYPEEVEKIKVILQELNKFVQDSFKAIKTEISIPNKVIEDYLSRFKDKKIREIIEIVSIDKGLIPDYKKSQESAIEQAKEFALQHIIPVSIFKNNLQVKTIIEEKDKLEFSGIRNFQIGYKITTGLLLSKIFELMEKENSDYIEELLKFISECPFIDKNRIPLISSGLKSYKNKEYVASIHILLFQIEGIIRDMLESMEIPTFAHRNNEMRARLLSDLIKVLDSVDGLDKNLVRFIDIFLNDVRGDNLRHDVAHSLSRIKEFSKDNNLLLILIILKLCSYRITKIDSKDSS